MQQPSEMQPPVYGEREWICFNPLRRAPRLHHGLPVLRGSFPLLGHMPAVMTNPSRMMFLGEVEHGPLFWVDAGAGKLALACNTPEAFGLLRSASVNSSHFYEQNEVFFGRSLLVADGAEHRHMRSAMNRPFSPGGLRRADIVRASAAVIERRVASWCSSSSLEILAETRDITLEIIFGIMGIPADDLDRWHRKFRHYMISALGPLWPWLVLRIAKPARRWLDERLGELLEQARAQGEAAPGLLGQLVRAQDESGLGLTQDELIDNLRLLVIAGHETSASALAWMMLFLAHHPHYWARLCEEASAGEDDLGEVQIADYPFAQALFRESVRMYAPVYAETRISHAPLQLEGFEVPVGTLLQIPLGAMSRDPRVFEQPDRFWPERWIDRERKISPIETSQFGGGHHFCLGYHLALVEGVQLAITAARALTKAGLRPSLGGKQVPSPVYVPLTHPPRSARVLLERAG